MDALTDFVENNFSELKHKYNLIIETKDGSLYTHLFNDYIHLYVNSEMFRRNKYALTVKVIRGNTNYFFTVFTLYHFAGLNVPPDYNHKNGFYNSVKLLDMHYSWLLNGEDSLFDHLVLYDLKHDFLVREHSDRRYYNNKLIHEENEVAWVSEMEHWVRHKYDLMLDMYYQKANQGNVPTYFPLNCLEMVKPMLIESLFMIS